MNSFVLGLLGGIALICLVFTVKWTAEIIYLKGKIAGVDECMRILEEEAAMEAKPKKKKGKDDRPTKRG